MLHHERIFNVNDKMLQNYFTSLTYNFWIIFHYCRLLVKLFSMTRLLLRISSYFLFQFDWFFFIIIRSFDRCSSCDELFFTFRLEYITFFNLIDWFQFYWWRRNYIKYENFFLFFLLFFFFFSITFFFDFFLFNYFCFLKILFFMRRFIFFYYTFSITHVSVEIQILTHVECEMRCVIFECVQNCNFRMRTKMKNVN